jgi:hypothetical protein
MKISDTFDITTFADLKAFLTSTVREHHGTARLSG